MEGGFGGVHYVSSAGLFGEVKLIIVKVDSDGRGAGKMRGRDGAEAYTSAAEDGNFVSGGDAASGDRVKTHCERFHETEFLNRKCGRVEFIRRHGNEFSQGTVALDAESFIKFASVGASAEAGSAFATICVRRHGDIYTGTECRERRNSFDDCGGNFVPGDAWELDHGIFASERIQVASAEADHTDTEKHFAMLDPGLGHRLDGGHAWLFDDQCSHHF